LNRDTIIGIILIFLVLIAWAYFTMPTQEEMQQRRAAQARQDSIAAAKADSQAHQPKQTASKKQQKAARPDTGAAKQARPQEHQQKKVPLQAGIFSRASLHDTSTVAVKTPLYHTTFTNVGAGPATFTLQKYNTWNDHLVQLISDTTRSAYNVGFMTAQSHNVDTDQLLFKQLTPGHTLQVKKGETKTLKYALDIGKNRRLIYTYTFHGDSYQVDLNITFKGLKQAVVGSAIDFGWTPQLNLTEKNRKKDASHKSAYAYSGGEREQLKLSSPDHKKKTYSGTVSWVATRTKWFTQIIKTNSSTVNARLIGDISKSDSAVNNHHYQSYIKTHLSDDNTASFQLYLGPLSFHDLAHYDKTTYGMVNIGYSWTRWFAEPLVRWIIIPFFSFLGHYMNMGLVIILFSIAIKIVLWPLTHKSFRSMAAMKELQPQMQEIKDKYSDDQQKQQKETMKLYKEANVNPLGGCLPQLLQLPILWTLYFYIRNSILLRQESFLWAHDLSTPDYILHLPFSIPILGHNIAGFALLMAVVMVLQMQFTGGMGAMGGGGGGGAGGMGNAFKYIMPIFLFFIFNNFAAGLSLYYLIYNAVNTLQQMIVFKEMEEGKIEVTKATA
jgi:YidC/Oxa1 family membrane protein insertase